jgi:hypothetical protein
VLSPVGAESSTGLVDLSATAADGIANLG